MNTPRRGLTCVAIWRPNHGFGPWRETLIGGAQQALIGLTAAQDGEIAKLAEARLKEITADLNGRRSAPWGNRLLPAFGCS